MKYKTPQAFRIALTERLRNQALTEGTDLQRLFRLVSFERFLARLSLHEPTRNWVVKGGYALELRFDGFARATKDLDLNIHPSTPDLLDLLQEAAEQECHDYFTYYISQPKKHTLTGPPEGGTRFVVDAHIGKRFTSFHLDCGQGDVPIGTIEHIKNKVDLSFAGVGTSYFPVYPIVDQFAEKLHAYTRPRERENSRLKDILDMWLFIRYGLTNDNALRQAIQSTFEVYGTHAVPDRLPLPPESWLSAFEHQKEFVGIDSNASLQDVHKIIADFLRNF